MAVGIGYDVVLAGDYAQRPAGKTLPTLSMGNLRMALLETAGELRLFGPARGCALHLLLLQAFARGAAAKLLGGRIMFWGEKLNCGPFAFRVGDQRKRWGSCSQRAGRLPKICLNWRALLLEPRLLDQRYSMLEKVDRGIDIKKCIFAEEIEELLERQAF